MDEKENTRELVVVDVKRYKKVKAALKDSEERYRQLFENVPIGIYRTTPDGRIVDANPALVKMAGFASFAELASLKLKQEYNRSSHERGDFIQRLKRDGEVKGLETIWRTRDGNEIHVRENAKLVRNESGEIFFEGTIEDITDSKLDEAAQKLRTQQLEILNYIISKGNMTESVQEMLEIDPRLRERVAGLRHGGSLLVRWRDEKDELRRRSRGEKKSSSLNEKYMSVESMPFAKVLHRRAGLR